MKWNPTHFDHDEIKLDTEPVNVKHFSNSSVNLYKNCPRAYMFHYPMGILKPKGARLILGTVHDKAISDVMLALRDEEDFDVEKLVNLHWKNEVESEDEMRRNGDINKDQLTSLIRARVDHGFNYEVESVQDKWMTWLYDPRDGEVDESYFMIGYPDAVVSSDHIVDFKTSAKRWSDPSFGFNAQGTMYQYLGMIPRMNMTYDITVKWDYAKQCPLCKKYGKLVPSGIGNLKVCRDCGYINFQEFTFRNYWDDVVRLYVDLVDIISGIENEIFPRCTDYTYCGPKSCDYYLECQMHGV